MSKRNIVIVLVVVLLGGGYVAKGVVMPPAKAHNKITGTIYLLPKEFLVNLTDGRYGKVDLGLVLAPGQSTGATAEAAAPSPDSEVGTLPEEAAVRDIVVNLLTNENSKTLVDPQLRARLKQRILLAIRRQTDVKLTDVLFTDVAVQ